MASDHRRPTREEAATVRSPQRSPNGAADNGAPSPFHRGTGRHLRDRPRARKRRFCRHAHGPRARPRRLHRVRRPSARVGRALSIAGAYRRVRVDPLQTNQPQRDAHRRSPDVFDVAQYPELHCESTAITAMDERTFRMSGRLTIHGVNQDLVLRADRPNPVTRQALNPSDDPRSAPGETAADPPPRWEGRPQRMSGRTTICQNTPSPIMPPTPSQPEPRVDLPRGVRGPTVTPNRAHARPADAPEPAVHQPSRATP